MKEIGRTTTEIITEVLENGWKCGNGERCECYNACHYVFRHYGEHFCTVLENFVEKIKTTDKVYESEDGEIFDDPQDCQAWEKYCSLSLKEICKPYFSKITFNKDETDTESFTYAIKIANMPEDVKRYIKLYIEKRKSSCISYVPFKDIEDNKPTLFFNNWSNDRAGAYGHNGWEYVGTIDQLQSKMNNIQEHLKEFE